MLRLWSPNDTFELETRDGETLLDCLRRANIPSYAVLAYDSEGNYASLSMRLEAKGEYAALTIRNPDLKILQPFYQMVRTSEPVSELFLTANDPWEPSLVQFSRTSGFDYIFDRFAHVLDAYGADSGNRKFQIALSSGGDGRIVAECAARYRDSRENAEFHAVITSTAFEDERSHVDNAVRIADKFGLAHSVYGNSEVQRAFGYGMGLNEITNAYHKAFPNDELEVLGTYWVQEINRRYAVENGFRAIIFGFNQEDAIADRLYQLLSGDLLDPYPVRKLSGTDILAPLHQVPKRLIDAMDLENSKRNYGLRVASVSPMRSSIYFIAYMICEQFPSLASILASTPLRGENPDAVLEWLSQK